MPAVPGPRPDQIQQPAGTNIGDVIAATANGPMFTPINDLINLDVTGLELGLSTGPISRHIPLSSAISSGTAGIAVPDSGSIGDVPVNIYPNNEERGEKLEFVIPDDYISGDVELLASYAMSTAEAGIVQLEADVTIADVTNGIIVTTTGATLVDFNPVDTTDFDRKVVFTIAEGTFSPGDVIIINLKRLGDQPTADSHEGDWQVAAFIYRYIGQVATRVITQVGEFFFATDEPSPSNGSLGEIPTTDYPPGTSTEQKVSFVVPDNWDLETDAQFRITYAMDSVDIDPVALETSGSIANVLDGTLDVLSPVAFDLIPPTDTGPHRSVVIRSISGLDLAVGNVITLKIARRGSTGGHGGILKVINAVMTMGQASSIVTTAPPAAATDRTYNHLIAGVFDLIAGSVTGDTEFPTVLGDFQTWDVLSSTSPGGEIHVAYEGQLTPVQDTISTIAVPIKGTGDYALKVYVEGAVTANPVYDSGIQVAPGSRTVLALTELDLTEQPTGEKRYYVVVEAFIDNGENVRVGRPFVRQD